MTDALTLSIMVKLNIMQFKNFKIHVYRGYVQNNYLVEYSDKILMVDGACRPDMEKIASFVKDELKRSMADIKLTAVTHCHPDHAGAAHVLREKYGIPVAAPYDIDIWYSGLGGFLQHLSDTFQANFMAMKMKTKLKRLYYRRKLNPDHKLFDGSELPHFSDWKAIHAPGHTSHNIMLYNDENRILYIADSIIDSNGKFLPPVPVLFPSEMKKTLLRIKEIKPDIILLAHSPSPFLEYNEEMIDKTLRKVDAKDPVFIRLFYLISKFTGEYRRRRERHS